MFFTSAVKGFLFVVLVGLQLTSCEYVQKESLGMASVGTYGTERVVQATPVCHIASVRQGGESDEEIKLRKLKFYNDLNLKVVALTCELKQNKNSFLKSRQQLKQSLQNLFVYTSSKCDIAKAEKLYQRLLGQFIYDNAYIDEVCHLSEKEFKAYLEQRVRFIHQAFYHFYTEMGLIGSVV